ncbi:hypothetical protein EDB85DRAFT_2289392 [Lactarius pseudohatsudake]|nr:hypothetical protein EDB85DRAFT_2289392 [Lactarius pseudohatsudake]
MMFMRTIVALSLVAFAFAVPVGEAAGNQVRRGGGPVGDIVGGLGKLLKNLLGGEPVGA